MTNSEYEEYLIKIENEYNNFIEIAKKIKPEDKSDKMKSLKTDSILRNIQLRNTLQKFRGSSCGCELSQDK